MNSQSSEKQTSLSTEIAAIREQLLASATGGKAVYSVRVDFDANDGVKVCDLAATHSVYSRSSY